MLEEAGVLVLADGGLRPDAALWMPDCMPFNRGFSRPDAGCLDPKVSTERKQWV